MADNEKIMSFKNRNEWRKWLEKNHEKEDVLWIAYFKKNSGQPSVSYNDAVEEALCFGWIDGKAVKIDDVKYKQRYTKRRKGAIWSALNIRRVEKMFRLGKMAEAGIAKVEEAKTNGEWGKAIIGADTSILPPELENAFKAEPKAGILFENLSNIYKKQFIWIVRNPKLSETRLKKADMVVKMLISGKKPGEKL